MRKSQENLSVNVWLGSKYASGIGFKVEKIYKMSVLTWYGQSRLQKFIIALLFLELIKNMLVSFFHDRGLYQKLTRQLICSANDWTSFYLIGTCAMNDKEGVIFCQVFRCYWQVEYIKTFEKKGNKPKTNNGLLLCCKLKFI